MEMCLLTLKSIPLQHLILGLINCLEVDMKNCVNGGVLVVTNSI